ncbi:TPA: hypothetical protein I7783_20625 [Vibrio vulnificus]|nr:hypothetical protein [Vibrio vulnificus]HAS8600392.1 hypothetical protein [Vibrio vulnificus]
MKGNSDNERRHLIEKNIKLNPTQQGSDCYLRYISLSALIKSTLVGVAAIIWALSHFQIF